VPSWYALCGCPCCLLYTEITPPLQDTQQDLFQGSRDSSFSCYISQKYLDTNIEFLGERLVVLQSFLPCFLKKATGKRWILPSAGSRHVAEGGTVRSAAYRDVSLPFGLTCFDGLGRGRGEDRAFHLHLCIKLYFWHQSLSIWLHKREPKP